MHCRSYNQLLISFIMNAFQVVLIVWVAIGSIFVFKFIVIVAIEMIKSYYYEFKRLNNDPKQTELIVEISTFEEATDSNI